MSEIVFGWPAESLASRLALTLVHFLWQGMLIAVLVWLIDAMLRGKSASTRYAVSLVGLVSMAVCAAATFAVVRADVQKDSIASIAGPSTAAISRPSENEEALPPRIEEGDMMRDDLLVSLPETQSLVVGHALETRPGNFLTIWRKAAPLIAGAYVFGVMVLLGRVLLGLHGGWRLRRHSEPIDDPVLLKLLKCRAQALQMRVWPPLCRCRDIAVPTVVGVVRPTILLPMSLATGLNPDQLEVILTHELAHIRRCDHLVNLLQRIIEAVLFFHPAVWWVSRQIRIERENCCDDVVLELGVEPVRYAELLVDIAEHQQRLRPIRDVALATAVQAAAGKSQVSQRVKRLLGVPAGDTFRLSRGGLVGAVAVGAIVLSTALALMTPQDGIGSPPKKDAANRSQNVARDSNVRQTVSALLSKLMDGEIQEFPQQLRKWKKPLGEINKQRAAVDRGRFKVTTLLSDGEGALAVVGPFNVTLSAKQARAAAMKVLTAMWLAGARVSFEAAVDPAKEGVTIRACMLLRLSRDGEKWSVASVFVDSLTGEASLARCRKEFLKFFELHPAAKSEDGSLDRNSIDKLVRKLRMELAFDEKPDAKLDRDPKGRRRKNSLFASEAKAAITRGLAFLAARHNKDGSFGADDGVGRKIGITSLCGMAFLLARDKPMNDKYAWHLKKSLEYLLSQCRRDGLIALPSDSAPMYGHAYATRFLAEAYAVDPVEAVGEKLKNAVTLIVRSQNESGGWRYAPTSLDSDVSVTACQLIALARAKKAGVDVPLKTMRRAAGHLKDCQNADGGFRYTPFGGPSGFERSAAALAALRLCGQGDVETIKRGRRFLAARIKDPDTHKFKGHYYFGHFHMGYAMDRADALQWRSWYTITREAVLRRQLAGGSWSNNSAMSIGAEYATASAILILHSAQLSIMDP